MSGTNDDEPAVAPNDPETGAAKDDASPRADDDKGHPPDKGAENKHANDKSSGDKSGNRTDPADNDQDPIGDDNRLANEAYRTGLKSYGNAVFADESRIKHIHLGNRYDYHIFPDPGSKKTSALVRAKVLDRIRNTYALVPMYERMLAMLREHRIVVLRGVPDTGLPTTAVRLLDDATGGQVARLDLTDGIPSIRGKDLSSGRGYVIRVPMPSEIQLDAFSELLAKRKCHCVLLDTAAPDDRYELDGYVFDYQPPDQRDLLRKHIAWRLGPGDPDDAEARLMALADGEELRSALGHDARPADVVQLADLLVRYVRDELDLADVRIGCAGRISTQVAEWFTVLRSPRPTAKKDPVEGLGVAAFRIALAVLNCSSYSEVVERAEALEQLMAQAIDPAAKEPRLSSAFLARRGILSASRAHIVPGFITFNTGAKVTAEFAEYEDDRLPSAILSHVWQEYGWMRQVLVEWLKKLGTAQSPLVWVRAAQAAGLLTALDFHDGFLKLVLPGARAAKDRRKRRFAAVAMDQAAQDARTQAAVRAFLRYWRRRGEPSERWTAAAALGYGIGLADIDTALNELRVLGTPDEYRTTLDGPFPWDAMVAVVSESVSRLLAFGAVETVVATLTDWLGHSRTSMRVLAQRTVERLISLRGSDLTYLDVSAGRDHPPMQAAHERWPLLLVLQNDDHQLTEPVATLLRLALRGRNGDDVADRFRSWIRTGQNDLGCLMALVRFLPRLVETTDDANRLIHLVARLARDWADPIRVEVADEVTAAIRAAIPKEVRPWQTRTMT